MGTDQLIEIVSNVCLKLLPVVGLILLIFIIVFIKHLIDVMKSVNVTLSKTNDLVDECKGQMRKLDKPLSTINDLSETVDNVHESAKSAVNTTINAIVTNLENVKQWINTRKGKTEETTVNVETVTEANIDNV